MTDAYASARAQESEPEPGLAAASAPAAPQPWDEAPSDAGAAPRASRMPPASTARRLWGLLRGRAALVAGVFIAGVLLLLTEGLVLAVALAVLGGALTEGAARVPALAPVALLLDQMPLVRRVMLAALLLVLLSAARGAIQFAQLVLSTRLQAGIERDLRTRLFQQWHRVRIDSLQRERAGATLATFTQYVTQTGRLLLLTADALVGLIVTAGYVALAFLLSWQLTLVALALAILSLLLLRPLAPVHKRILARRLRDQQRDLQAQALESLSAMRTIRVYRREGWSLARMAQALDEYYGLTTQIASQTGLARPVSAVVMMTFVGVVMVTAALLLQGSEEARLAQLALFLLLTVRLVGPLQSLTGLQAQWTVSAPSVEAIFETLDAGRQQAIADGVVPLPQMQAGIVLEDVAFAYPDSPTRALRGVSLEIARGEVVALVGPSGSGKSTIVNLICRLYDADNGRICVDGHDLRTLRLDDWLGQVALVGQDTYLFHDSIEANLRFVRPNATPAQVEQAARQAQAHLFIEALPDGYQTVIRDRGVRLSGGQRQRLALARAFLVDPELLILDEATSELDGETESAVQQTLDALRGSRTLLVIAHRLSTVARADRIYVLEEGRVVEQGRHDDLMARSGRYAALFGAQDHPARTVQ